MKFDYSPEEIEAELSKCSQQELDRFADNLQQLTKFLATTELKKALARRIAKLNQRLEEVEKTVGGDKDDDGETKWPSLA